MQFKRIRDLREDRDYTQVQLAEYLHVHQATYCKYENGEIYVPLHVFIKLAELYGVSVDYIAGLTDEMQPHRRINK